MLKNNITILIQGPAHLNSINNIDFYKKYGNIVYSTWTPENHNEKENINLIKQKSCKLILNNLNIFNKIILNAHAHNYQNIFKQSVTTFSALCDIDTEFVIKLRSDEKYENLEPLLNKIKNNPNKIITSNIFFRKSNIYLYHVSDHIIAGNTNTLKNIYNNMITYCLDKKIDNISKNILKLPHITQLVAEQIFTICSIPLMIPKNFNKIINYRDEKFCKFYIKEYFDIIDVNLLNKYIISYTNKSNRHYSSNISDIHNYETDIINSIKEY